VYKYIPHQHFRIIHAECALVVGRAVQQSLTTALPFLCARQSDRKVHRCLPGHPRTASFTKIYSHWYFSTSFRLHASSQIQRTIKPKARRILLSAAPLSRHARLPRPNLGPAYKYYRCSMAVDVFHPHWLRPCPKYIIRYSFLFTSPQNSSGSCPLLLREQS
jgi:hypothetical protein